MKIKILVATHIPYWMPGDDVYLPLQVGKEGKKGFGLIGDNTGQNISNRNTTFCELTGLYWAWKNLHTQYIGLCHYRRYFAHDLHAKDVEAKHKAILLRSDYERLLTNCDCILPIKRNYYIETVRSQYEHAHNKRDLDELECIIKEKYPEYSEAFAIVMNRKRLHILNMFVMKWELFDQYCTFLFDVLFELEKRIDISDYDSYEARVFGFLGERLLNVWLEKKQIAYKEIPVIFFEHINWIKKGGKFLMRKFGKRS